MWVATVMLSARSIGGDKVCASISVVWEHMAGPSGTRGFVCVLPQPCTVPAHDCMAHHALTATHAMMTPISMAECSHPALRAAEENDALPTMTK